MSVRPRPKLVESADDLVGDGVALARACADDAEAVVAAMSRSAAVSGKVGYSLIGWCGAPNVAGPRRKRSTSETNSLTDPAGNGRPHLVRRIDCCRIFAMIVRYRPSPT